MYEVIKRFCDDESRKNGLMLLTCPTGFGKTHSIIEYIYDAIAVRGVDKKIFFITTLKKNIPSDDLKKKFEENGKADLFDEKFIRVEPYVDEAKAFLSNKTNAEKIPEDIKKASEYENLVAAIKKVDRANESKVEDRNYVESLEDELGETETRFRRLLRRKWNREIKDLKGKIKENLGAASSLRKMQNSPIQYIRERQFTSSDTWSFVLSMYPSMLLEEKQIIFMSVDKFVSPWDPIVKSALLLYDSDIINGALVFVDEFDATKDKLIDRITRNAADNETNCIKLFENIHSALNSREIPSVYINEKSREAIEKNKKIFDERHEEYFLKHDCKLESEESDKTKFLFQSNHGSIDTLSSTSNSQRVLITHDSETNTNQIFTKDEIEDEKDEKDVHEMLAKIRGAINYFCGLVTILADVKLEREKGDHYGNAESERKDAVRSVLNTLLLDKEQINCLEYYINSSPQITKNSSSETCSIEDLSFYENGFSLYSFADDKEHDTQTYIQQFIVGETAEKILLRICRRAKVLGCSATADIRSPIANYDVDGYLKTNLGDDYTELKDDEKERLKKEYDEYTKEYSRTEIHVDLIRNEIVADDGEQRGMWSNLIDEALKSNYSEHLRNRYVRIANVFYYYFKNDIRSLLCFLTLFPKEGSTELDLNALRNLFKKIGGAVGKKADPRELVILTSTDFDNFKEEKILTPLSEGKRRFVITTYQTLGAGQNMQYRIPKDAETIKINDRESDEMDFEAIYLDMPTYLLVQPSGKIVEKVKGLYQAEELFGLGMIPFDQYRDRCLKLLKADRSKGNPVGEEWFSNAYKKMIIQAIGRIGRTPNKARNIFVFADYRLTSALNVDSCKKEIDKPNSLFAPEYNKLINKLYEEGTTSNSNDVEYTHLKRQAENRHDYARSKIYKTLKLIGTHKCEEKIIREWQALRSLSLKYPTASEEEIRTGKDYYWLELPENSDVVYYKAPDGDYESFKSVEIEFKETKGYKNVSAEAGRLFYLMKCEPLKKHFEEKGFATEFVPNKYILQPIIFNNIYRGALGEEAGKFLFEHYWNLKLIEVEQENFEMFDFKVEKDGYSAYVDFKNYNDTVNREANDTVEKIVEKAKECNTNHVIWANVFGTEKHDPWRDEKDGIKILFVPRLLESKEDGVSIKPINDYEEEVRKFVFGDSLYD